MSAVEDFLQAFPNRAEIAQALFRKIRDVRDRRPLIHRDRREITFLTRDALDVVKGLERDALALRKARDVLQSWCSNQKDISAEVTENEDGGLATWVGGETKTLRRLLLQASAVLEAYAARLQRQANLLRKEWGASQRGGRPEKDAVLLKPVAALLWDQPQRTHRLWTERLAPELLGRELPREQQRDRVRSRRAKRHLRERHPVG